MLLQVSTLIPSTTWSACPWYASMPCSLHLVRGTAVPPDVCSCKCCSSCTKCWLRLSAYWEMCQVDHMEINTEEAAVDGPSGSRNREWQHSQMPIQPQLATKSKSEPDFRCDPLPAAFFRWSSLHHMPTGGRAQREFGPHLHVHLNLLYAQLALCNTIGGNWLFGPCSQSPVLTLVKIRFAPH